MTRRHSIFAVVIAVFAAVATFNGGAASADISKNVIATFRGQIVVTKDDLPEAKTDKDTIAKIKAAKLGELAGTSNGDVTAWTFHYAAFLTKTGASALKLEFWRDGKTYSADKRLEGVDPKSGVLTGEISIDEDENITKGKSYLIKLVAGSDTVVATTTLIMK
jgi:hypothetical protein